MNTESIKLSSQQLEGYFKAVKDELLQEQKDQVGAMMIELQTLKHEKAAAAKKEDIEAVNVKINDIVGKVTDIFNNQVKNQTLLDNLATEQKRRSEAASERKDFQSTWDEDIVNPMKEMSAKIDKAQKLGEPITLKLRHNRMNLQEKGIMTVSNTLTGTGQITFNDRPGLVPAQKINFRDLLRTVSSGPNGLYVTYRETNTVQAVGKQTDGSAKANLQYTFQAITATLAYIAGFVTLTKQVMFNLPFLEQTLPTFLLRDFYKKENDYLFTTIASNSTGTSTPAGTSAKADVEELIQVIASQRGRNFNASAGIVDWTEWQRILTTKPNDYSIPGGVVITGDGTIMVAGMPVIPAAWAQTDHVLVYDADYYERVEGDSLSVTFSYENQDNFEKNQVTARIECFEEINRLRDDASVYYDFGNS